jgi:hypothetical protein
MRRRAAPANKRRANNSRGLRAPRFAARKRKKPISGYPSPTKSILTLRLLTIQHSGWYHPTQEWSGYNAVQEAWVWNYIEGSFGPSKVKKDAKTRVFGGFSPKTRGRIILTLIRFRYYWSLIFCRNLHTKIIPLAPREPRNTLFCIATGTINKRRMCGHVDAYAWAMFLTSYLHTNLPAKGRF